MDRRQRHARTRILVLLIAMFALTCGTIGVASYSAPTPDVETKGPPPSQSADAASAAPTQSESPVPTQNAETATPVPADPVPSAAQPTVELPAPAPELIPESAPSPISLTLPMGDLPGWRQVFAEDFNEGDVGLGAFPGIYGGRWSANYFDGTPDTAAQLQPKGARTSGYFPSKVLSVHDGVLDMFLHSENGVAMGAAPSPIVGGAVRRPWNSQVYGRYSVRFKAEVLPGFKLAWLLWPDSKQWPQDGEIDFPEGDLGKVIYGAVHGVQNGIHEVEVRRPNVPYGDWHIATTEWGPGGIEFFLDGRSIGVSSAFTPSTPMHYILQTESCSPDCPAPETNGHVYVDWVAIWERT